MQNFSKPPFSRSFVFGPKIKAPTTLVSGKFHLSQRSIKKLFSTFFNIDISLGSVNVENQAAIPSSQPHEEALKILRRSSTVYCDETGWRTKKQTKWLWQATDKTIVVFKIFAPREIECIALYLQRKTTPETARVLHLSSRTVENDFEIIKQKLNCRHKSEIYEKIKALVSHGYYASQLGQFFGIFHPNC